MNFGLLELPKNLRNFLTKRNGTNPVGFSLQDPTPGLISGGNARGSNASDLQMTRTASGQVASGAASFTAGSSNTASGSNSVAIGSANTASATNAVSLGGSNSASATGSFCAGQNNTANANNSSVPGGARATTNSITGAMAYGFNGGGQTTAGLTQMSFVGLYISTTGATATRATTDAAAAATGNQLTLRNNSVFRVRGSVVARDSVTNDAKEWEIVALVKRGAAAANTAVVGTPTVTSLFADTNAASWAVSVAADTTNGSLGVTVTGAGTNAIRWTAVLWSTEVA